MTRALFWIEAKGDSDMTEHLEAGSVAAVRGNSAVNIKEAVNKSFAIVQERYQKKNPLSGLPSGFRDLDALTCGLQRSELTIISARCSMGKTALVLNVAEHVAVGLKLPVLFFSLESSKELLVQRLLTCMANVDTNRLRTGQMDSNAWQSLESAKTTLEETPLIIDDFPVRTVSQVQERCRSIKANLPDLALIIIDCLQDIKEEAAVGREPEIRAETAAILKTVAVELNLPVIAVSKLGRSVEARRNKRPMLCDLDGSATADVVIFPYRDEYYNPDSQQRGEAELIIACAISISPYSQRCMELECLNAQCDSLDA